MKKWPLGSEVRRKVFKRGAMLYDAFRAGNLAPEMFDPAYWAQHGRLHGTAKGGRGTTHFVRSEGGEWVLRHYHRGGLVSRVSRDRYFWSGESRTRSMIEWQLTYHMHRAGLPVPTPIGARYVRRGFRYTADFITERLPDAQSLSECLQLGALSVLNWIAIGRVFRRFHDLGVCHADLNAHNIMLGAGDSCYLIDFDRAILRKPGWWCDANLVRLRRSLEKISYALPSDRFTDADWHGLLDGYNVSSGAGVLKPMTPATPEGPHVWKNLPVVDAESPPPQVKAAPPAPVPPAPAKASQGAPSPQSQANWPQPQGDETQPVLRVKGSQRAPGSVLPPAQPAGKGGSSSQPGSTGSGESQQSQPRGARVPQGSQWAEPPPAKGASSAQGVPAPSGGKDPRGARGGQPSQNTQPPQGSEWGKDARSGKGAQVPPQAGKPAPNVSGHENAAAAAANRDSQSPPASRGAQSGAGASNAPSTPARKDPQGAGKSPPGGPGASSMPPPQVRDGQGTKAPHSDQSGAVGWKQGSPVQSPRPAAGASTGQPASGSQVPRSEPPSERSKAGQSSVGAQSSTEWSSTPDSRGGRSAAPPQSADRPAPREGSQARDGQLSSTGKFAQGSPGSVGRSAPPPGKESASPAWRDAPAPRSGVAADSDKSARPQSADAWPKESSGSSPASKSPPASKDNLSADSNRLARSSQGSMSRDAQPSKDGTISDTGRLARPSLNRDPQASKDDPLSETSRSARALRPSDSLSESRGAEASKDTANPEDDKFDWEIGGSDAHPFKDDLLKDDLLPLSDTSRSVRGLSSSTASKGAPAAPDDAKFDREVGEKSAREPQTWKGDSLSDTSRSARLTLSASSKAAQAPKDTASADSDKSDRDIGAKAARDPKESPPSDTGRFARTGASSASKGAPAWKEDTGASDLDKTDWSMPAGGARADSPAAKDGQLSETGKYPRSAQSDTGSSGVRKTAGDSEAEKSASQKSEPSKEAPLSETGKYRTGQSSSSGSSGSIYTKWLKESTKAKDGTSSTGKFPQLTPGLSSLPISGDAPAVEGSSKSDSPAAAASSATAQSSSSSAQSAKAPISSSSSTDQGGQDSQDQDSMDWEFFGEEPQAAPSAKTPKPPPRT